MQRTLQAGESCARLKCRSKSVCRCIPESAHQLNQAAKGGTNGAGCQARDYKNKLLIVTDPTQQNRVLMNRQSRLG